jgi:hypothetical protein
MKARCRMFSFQLSPLISFADVVGLVGLFFAGFGLIFNATQLRQNNVTRRAELLLTILNQYFNNQSQRDMYYRLDYGQFRFTPNDFPGSEEEKALDGILYNLDVVGRLLRIGAITLDEAHILEFEVQRVLKNQEVIKYLRWLEEQTKAIGEMDVPFEYAKHLSKALSKRKDLQASKAK